MEEKLIDKIALENGLILELYDCSKRVAADRWLVCFIARIGIDMKQEHFEGEQTSDLPFDDIRTAVGDKVTYRYEKTRNFIAKTEKDEVFNGLKERFLKATLDYLSSPVFARKLILKRYQETRGHQVNRESQ